jgi:hypothetical protein
MLTWEQQPAHVKTNFDLTKAYFEAIVRANDVYEQNTGSGAARGNKYESVQQMADIGDKLRDWIQKIASNGANNERAANTQATKRISLMEADSNDCTNGSQNG